MTITEYETKLQILRTSDAPFDVKEAAITKLQAMYYTESSQAIAKQQFEESKADTNDIGDDQ